MQTQSGVEDQSHRWKEDHERAWALVEAEDYSAALELYSHLAEAGSSVAHDVIGWMHLTGRGTAKDPGVARLWFQKASEAGYSWGQYHLGYIAMLEGNFDVARGWFEKAASQGHTTAEYRLGVLYWLGQGVPADQERAYGHFNKAAEKGHVLARRDMLKIESKRAPSVWLRLWCQVLLLATFFKAIPIILKDPHDERLDLG